MEEGKGDGAVPRWCELDRDIMECILRKLCLVDVLRSKWVCSWWFSVAKGFASSYFGYPPSCQSAAPWLLIPHIDQDDRDDDADEGAGRRAASGEKVLSRLSFFNLDEKKVIRNVCECPEVYAGECIGSSHGWLVLLDTKANLSVFNPFLGARIQVCSLEKVFDWLDAHDNFRCWENCEENCRTLIWKAVLVPISSSSSTSIDENKKKKNVMMINKDKDAVFVIYGLHASEVGYCTLKEGSIFTHLGSTVGHYEYKDSFDDVIRFNNMICAVTRGGNVQVWDFTSASSSSSSSDHHRHCPIMVANIRYHNYPRAEDIFWERLSDIIGSGATLRGENQLFYHGANLVESCGELLHLTRFYVEHGHEDRREIGRFERTLTFVVTRVDIAAKKVVEDYRPPKGDRVLFLDAMGTSISLNMEDCPGCLKDSVYFTPPLRPGPIMIGPSPMAIDMGIYNFKDLSVNPFYDTFKHTPRLKIKPIPFWFFPS